MHADNNCRVTKQKCLIQPVEVNAVTTSIEFYDADIFILLLRAQLIKTQWICLYDLVISPQDLQHWLLLLLFFKGDKVFSSM